MLVMINLDDQIPTTPSLLGTWTENSKMRMNPRSVTSIRTLPVEQEQGGDRPNFRMNLSSAKPIQH